MEIDLISDIVAASQLHTTLYFRAELSTPFCIQVPTQHSHIRFHLANKSTWIETDDGTGHFVSEGELLLVPHGSGHKICSEKNLNVTPLDDVMKDAVSDHVGHIKYGNGPDYFELVCGHFSYNESIVHPLISTLPEIVHINTKSDDFKWLPPMLATMLQQQNEAQPGHEQILARLSETIFIQILRHIVETQPNATQALQSLVDPKIGRVLKSIHHDPGKNWSLERLAEEAGMSRSSFADHFKTSLGITPMRYLTDWRMQKATALLRNPKLSISDVATAVGYRSQAAFSNTFRNYFDVSASDYRKTDGREFSSLWR